MAISFPSVVIPYERFVEYQGKRRKKRVPSPEPDHPNTSESDVVWPLAAVQELPNGAVNGYHDS